MLVHVPLWQNCTVPLGFFPSEIWVAFPGLSQFRQCYATQTTVNVGCFSVYIIRQCCATQPTVNVGCFSVSIIRQCCATQPTVNVGCFSVSIIHRTIGLLTCKCDPLVYVYTRGLAFIVSSAGLLWGTESAQTFDSEKTRPQSTYNVQHETVTHPCGGYA